MHRMSDLDLILEVQKYPLLYDTSLQAYQDSPLKNQAWLAIAKHTKVPGKYQKGSATAALLDS